MRGRRFIALCAVLVTGSLAAGVLGCVAGGGVGDESLLVPANVRTGGGSIPDGEPVAGTVVEYALVTDAPSDGSSASYTPVEGAEVTLTDSSGATEVTTTSDGLLPDGSVDPLPEGSFVFASPSSGKSTLTFDLNGDLYVTEIDVNVRGGQRCEVIASLVPDCTLEPDSANSKLTATCDVRYALPGSQPVPVRATLQGVTYSLPEIVWVMRTSTDASILPGARPQEVLVVPGALEGRVEVRAHLGDAKSNAVRIDVKAR